MNLEALIIGLKRLSLNDQLIFKDYKYLFNTLCENFKNPLFMKLCSIIYNIKCENAILCSLKKVKTVIACNF